MSTEAILEKINELLAGQEQIHTLVNSNLTAQMNDTLDARVRDLASLKEIMSLKEEKGLDPTPEALQVIEATEHSIGELRAKLRDRAEATEIGAKEAEKD